MEEKKGNSGIIDKTNMTPEGRSWITLASDPFHDLEVTTAGYPDGRVSHSYILVQKESLDLAAPGAGPWDAHFSIVPEMMYYADDGYYADVNVVGRVQVTNAQDPPLALGNVIIHTVDATLPTWNNGTHLFPGPINLQALPTSNAGLEEGAARVVAIAFEVHNTSTPLDRGGSVCCYRMPSGVTRETHLVVDENTVSVGKEMVIESYQPPALIGAANRIPNSRTWEAKDGAYVVGTFGVDGNDIVAPQFGRRVFVGDADNISPASLYYLPNPNENMTFAPTSMDIAGAYFTNLPGKSTLRINVVRYLEVSPITTSLTISAATRAAPYDDLALSTYYRVKNAFPAGVPVAFNAAGDWWRMVKGAIGKIATQIPGLIDQTFFGGVPVAKTLVGGGKKLLKQKKSKKSKQNKSQSQVNAKSSLNKKNK